MFDTPMPVTVVRPKRGLAFSVGHLIAALAYLALRAWIVMLAAGALTPWHLSYWNAVLLCFAVPLLLRAGSNYGSWTKGANE